MRVLVIDEALPYPTDSGKRIRTFELLRRLARDDEITMIFHRDGPAAAGAETPFRDAGIALHPVGRRPLVKTGPRFLWDLGRNVVLPVPYMVMAHRTRALRRAIREAVARIRPSLIHVEWTPLAANVPADIAVPVCIAAHNVETQIWERYLENETNPIRRAYVALQVAKVRRFERRALAGADAVVAVSEDDGQRIREWAAPPRVAVVPNGVDAEVFTPHDATPVRPRSTVFVGSLDWRPNLDAVTWFLDDVWPRLRALCPTATFTVVGRTPPDWLVRRVEGLDGVRLEASVPDVRPHVREAAVSVVPLRIGGGSRLKICEALAMERPLVSTSIGAEGLDLGDGIAVADDGEAFAKAVVALFDDEAQAGAMARRGRARVLDAYEWGEIAPLQAAVWRDLAAGGEAAE